MRRSPKAPKRRSDWGKTTSEMVAHMTSGNFKREQKEKRNKAKRSRLFHNIRRVDRQFEGESRIFYDKLAFKQKMEENNILTPKTYAIVDREKRLNKFWMDIADYETFVIKPDRMSEGRGIRVLKRTEDPTMFLEMNGDRISIDTIRKEIVGALNRMTNNRRIRGDRNKVYAEERIFVNDALNNLTVYDGIVDFRVYLLIDETFKKKEVLYSKVRCPLKKSKGMGNTAKGAVALFVDADGKICNDDIFTNTTTKYRKTDYEGNTIPFWNKVKEKAEEVGNLFKSPFHSVDMTVNKDGEVVVIEAEKIPLLRYHSPDESDRIANRIIKFAEEVLFK